MWICYICTQKLVFLIMSPFSENGGIYEHLANLKLSNDAFRWCLVSINTFQVKIT